MLSAASLVRMQGAIDLLMALLSGTYVLPVHGAEVLHPHTEFDADSKTLLKWIKRKDEVKRFQLLLKESRLRAYREAGVMHMALRSVLVTKLSHLHSAFFDAPALLCKQLPVLLAALALAQDEVQWWVQHADAVPKELTRKEVDAAAEARAYAYHPGGSVQALLRLMESLYNVVAGVTGEGAAGGRRLAEDAAVKMLEYQTSLDNLVSAVCHSGALPQSLGSMLRAWGTIVASSRRRKSTP